MPAIALTSVEAIEWLARAQDGTPDDGFARGYSVLYNRYFGDQGWQPSYPETTGYVIPTLLHASQHLERPQLAERALRAARWEIEVQLESGAVQGGVIGEGRSPAVFNTGQVMFGWLAAFEKVALPSSPTRPSGPVAISSRCRIPMATGGRETLNSPAATRLCTTPASPGHSPKPG
jgi:hypothetical protein